ncbi:hypothetical protein [Deinococcus arcticus]|uniref:hypothetical protein n=1 Tax=Deinococcus arcticus TaxID=2136176 RepID=UPI0011B1CEBA|nr:hypothetical protein [Deinococcus arcticus]
MLGLVAGGVMIAGFLFGLLTLWAALLLLMAWPWHDRTVVLRRLGFTLTWGGVTASIWGTLVGFEETGMGYRPVPEDSVSDLWMRVGFWGVILGVAVVLWAVAREYVGGRSRTQ